MLNFLKNGKGNYHGWSDATWAQVQDIKCNNGKQPGIPSPLQVCAIIKLQQYGWHTMLSRLSFQYQMMQD